MSYGLTAEGFVPKTLEIIVEELRAAFKVAFGNSINVTTGIISKMLAIFAEREALLWELAEAIYKSNDPDAALDEALDAICALTGCFRAPATASVTVFTLTGVPATLVATGSRAKVPESTAVFESTADGTIVAATAWVLSTPYVVGNRRTNDGKMYICITSGVSAASGGPVDEIEDETDGTTHWRFMGEGTGDVDVTARAVDAGEVFGVSGTITEIETAVGGWDGVINLLDAVVGSDRETNSELRQRRDRELAAAGTSPIPAIRAALLKIEGVTAATVFYNTADVVDGDGIPGHSVEPLVRTTWAPGDDRDQLIFDCLAANVAGGIGTHGDVVGTHEDTEGTEHEFKFRRADEIEIYVVLEVEADEDEFPADGEDQIKAAIVAWGALQKSGKNAASSPVAAQAHTVLGVNEVTDCFIGIAPAPGTSTTIAIALRELATYDTSRITVNVTFAVP